MWARPVDLPDDRPLRRRRPRSYVLVQGAHPQASTRLTGTASASPRSLPLHWLDCLYHHPHVHRVRAFPPRSRTARRQAGRLTDPLPSGPFLILARLARPLASHHSKMLRRRVLASVQRVNARLTFPSQFPSSTLFSHPPSMAQLYFPLAVNIHIPSADSLDRLSSRMGVAAKHALRRCCSVMRAGRT